MMLLLLPGLWLLNLYHWFGLLLDEVLFRGYRKVEVEAPVFVLGVPRSGTTFMHDVLAGDEATTTFATWECYFGLSVTWRRFWRGIGHLDRRLGRPGGRLVDALTRRLASGFEDTHPVRLDAPEEDFLCLLPTLTCFLLVVPFPDMPDLWRMARLDDDADEGFRERQLAFYRRCIQRHLHVHGRNRRFLSKNASFAGLLGGLARTFPDARFICCLREPERALSSQFSVLDDSLRTFAGDGDPDAFRRYLTECFAFYYDNLLTHAGTLPDRVALLGTREIRQHLAESVEHAFRQLGLPMSDRFRAHLSERDRESRAHRSGHSHDLAEAGLSADNIRERFRDVHARFDFHHDRFDQREDRERHRARH